jgi:23S rRNA U2552 (ribose-2'-O)-methylase RlmE/FtsJ
MSRTPAAHTAYVVLSDIAPNMTASMAATGPKERFSGGTGFDFARQLLKPNGAVLIKTLQGAGFEELTDSARQPSPQGAIRQTGRQMGPQF